MDRRSVLRAGLATGGGLCILVGLVPPGLARAPSSKSVPAELGVHVRIAETGEVYFWLARTEMGQGVSTSLAMLLAEELDVPLSALSVEPAPADIARFGMQVTGGSRSIQSSFEPLRHAGAAARAMLVTEAASRWGIAPDACTTRDGMVLAGGPKGKRLSYAALASAAAQRPVPTDVKLKSPEQFRLIGQGVDRIDGKARVDGSERYGIDAVVPGMRVASLLLPPRIGSRVGKVDDSVARTIPGVETVVRTEALVAVIAKNSWSAWKGRDALNVDWSIVDPLSTEAIFQDLESAVRLPGIVAAETPGIDKVLATAPRKIVAEYRQPFLAHAPMEPMNCLVHVREGECEIWTGTQIMGPAQLAVAAALGISPSKVTIHNHPMGGGFGRRLEADGILAAVSVARQVPYPVTVIWTRSDDLRGDMYRPAYVDRLEAALGDDGRPVGWLHRIAGSSIMARTFPDEFKGVDTDAVECAVDPLYTLAERRIEYRRVEPGKVPTSWWRGVGPLRSTFVLESFIDELATAAGVDVVAYRKALLSDPRALAVLERAAAGRPERLAQGQGWGIAVQKAFGSYAAMTALLSMQDGEVKVERLRCVVDCGQPINPRGIEAQVEGGALFGLSAALTGAITLKDGAIEQGNYDDFPVLRISAAPQVDVEIISSTEKPGGMGELATILAAPALVNALYVATKRRIRTLPVGDQMREKT